MAKDARELLIFDLGGVLLNTAVFGIYTACSASNSPSNARGS